MSKLDESKEKILMALDTCSKSVMYTNKRDDAEQLSNCCEKLARAYSYLAQIKEDYK